MKIQMSPFAVFSMILHSINRVHLVKLSTLFFRINISLIETHRPARTGSKTKLKRFSKTLDQNSNRPTYVIIFDKQIHYLYIFFVIQCTKPTDLKSPNPSDE